MVFRLNRPGLGLVVSSLDFSVGDGVGLDVVFQVGLGQLILAADIQRGGYLRFLVQSLVDGLPFTTASGLLLAAAAAGACACANGDNASRIRVGSRATRIRIPFRVLRGLGQ
jgi:hypothetical protein